MRTLKFRLFKGNVLQGEVELKPNGIIDVAYEWDIACQFTGLLSRSGKEIYEGDIVSCADIIVAVTWKDAGFHIITNESQGASMFVQERAKHFEVIGNIYENPELL